MKPFILAVFSFTAFLITILPIPLKKQETSTVVKELNRRKMLAVRCSPDWSVFKITDEQALAMIPLPGVGNHTWHISSTVDSADFYFNQGMNLYYGFHIPEAIPSLRKAAQLDKDCAML